jgi:hypothetical protein
MELKAILIFIVILIVLGWFLLSNLDYLLGFLSGAILMFYLKSGNG